MEIQKFLPNFRRRKDPVAIFIGDKLFDEIFLQQAAVIFEN